MAKGFSSRALRRRSSDTAGSLRASQARWYPPTPLIAPMRPRDSSRAAKATGSGSSSAAPRESSGWSVGPHRGQQVGCAWTLRSDGSSHSALQSGQSAKRAIVVRSRSYGAPVTTVSRGPQLVQFKKGCRKRRSPGSSISRKQSSQVATSGEIWTAPPGSAELSSIWNRASPRGGDSSQVISSMRASGGGRWRTSSRNRSSAWLSPSTSMSTPPARLHTNPPSPSRDARPWTNGRNPTPWTTPSTAIERRARTLASMRPAYSFGGNAQEASVRSGTIPGNRMLVRLSAPAAFPEVC